MSVMDPLARAGVAGRCPDVPAARTAGKHRRQLLSWGYSVSDWEGVEDAKSLSREMVRNLVGLILGLDRNRRKSALRICNHESVGPWLGV